MKFLSHLTLFAAACLFASHARSQTSPLPADTRATDTVKWENGVGLVESKGACLIFGDGSSAKYRAEAELRLAPGGLPLGVIVLSDQPYDGTTGGFDRMNLVRGKTGFTLHGRRAAWNPETSRWDSVKEQPIVLDYQLDPAQKGIKPALDEIARDGVTMVPLHERWIRVRVDVTDAHADLWIDGQHLRRVPLKDRQAGPVTLVLSKGDQVRAVKFESQKAASSFVPIELGPIINNGVGAAPTVSAIEHDKVPFRVLDDGNTSLDLRKAGWPDALRDPSSYNEPFDDGPLFQHDPRTPTLRVPVEDYAAVHVLAVADDAPDTHAGFTIRAGHMATRGQCVLYDFPAKIPRRGDVAKEDPARVVTLGDRKFVHVRVPFTVAFGQDISRWIDLQLTREVRLARRRPDPSRFRFRPLGLPSGAQIAAVTLERSPLQVRVTSAEAGHAFVEPMKPEFTVSLRNVSAQGQSVEIRAGATHLDGTRTKADTRGKVEPGKSRELKLAIPVSKRGYHDIEIALIANGKPLFSRHTSFAVLPPDTRAHRDQSPFGTWDFSGGHYTCNDPDIVGSLYKKAGLRYGMFGFTAEERAKWGVRQGTEPKLTPDIESYRKWIERSPDGLPVGLIMHEDSISGGHVTRVPDIFHDRPPYQLNDTEKERFDKLWETCINAARVTREHAPKIQIRLGNGPLTTKEAFLQRGFPKELFDALGNEAGSFGRPPESQPPDYVANNASIWMDHELLKAYGYEEKPVIQCYEICYPSTNPGNLAPETQAEYLVRHAVHSMVWGIPEIRFGCILDVGSSYRFSNWGASGLARWMPELNVKPAYVAVATMTRSLDGAKFSRALDLGSPSLYAVEFHRADKKRVYVLWTIRGQRPVQFTVTGNEWSLTDEQGNDTQLVAKEGKVEALLTPSPVYLVGNGEVNAAEPRRPTYTDAPRGKVSNLAGMDSLDGWKVEADRNYVIEYHNFVTPRRKGDFAFEPVAEFDGQKNALRITPRPVTGGKPTMPMYAVLRHDKGIPIPGEPTEIGLWVNGNSSWGRVIFELRDAKGQTWTSIGASQRGELSPWLLDWMPKEALENTKQSTQADWNTDDVFGLSRINFDGWRYVGFPLPGNYPGERYPWPASSQWKSDGDGVVHYPLTVKAVIIELPEKTLHLKTFAPAPRPDIYLKRLVAAQDDAPTVKTTISEWKTP